MNIKQEREFIQQLLEEDQLDSLSVQVIALNIFANSLGYKAVNGDVRKGFSKYSRLAFSASRQDFCSLEKMQYKYNHNANPKEGKWFVTEEEMLKNRERRIVDRVSIQYNKKLGKLTSELRWLKFIKED